ncbi:MAG: hypothetical protein WC309_01630 [Candidatus Paceibacterota bacterium]|jgi:hypothetical protein
MKTIITILLTLCMFGSLQGQGRFEKIMEEAAKKTDMELLGIGKLADVRGVQDAIEQQQDNFDKAVGESFLRLWDRYAGELYSQVDTIWVPVFGYFQNDSSGGWSRNLLEKNTESRVIKTITPTKIRQEEGLIILPRKLEFDIYFIEWLKKQ